MSYLDALAEPCAMSEETFSDTRQATVDTAHIVAAVHACVPGRIRWRVRGLRQNPALKQALEAGLPELPGIHSASASTATGNLLTLFDPDLSADRISGYIAALVRGDVASVRQHPAGPEWHAQEAGIAVEALQTSARLGLTTDAARERLAEHGANALPPPPVRSRLAIFLDQFQNLPAAMLLAAGAFSIVTGGLVEAAAILGVVGFNGILGTVIEERSERTISSLGTAGHEPAHVLRDGVLQDVPPEAVVPGDVLNLLPGTIVPADARILSARELRISEAMLTGESLPVAKHAAPVAGSPPLAERSCIVYRGTAVTGGSGTAVVVATGSRTEMGRIQRLVGAAAAPQTAMQIELDQLGRLLVWASLAACGAVMGVGMLRGIALFQAIRSGVSLAVAAIPEGLPTVATTTLALGIEDMRKRGVLVRRLDAIESLASVGVVCFDKTGTLTLNQMRTMAVAAGGHHFRAGPDGELLDADGRRIDVETAPGSSDPLSWLLRIGVLCSDSDLVARDGRIVPSGSATECALVQLALDSGVDAVALRRAYPRLAVRHRAEGYRFMATVHRAPVIGPAIGMGRGDDGLVAVKGSPAEVLDLCSHELRDGVRYPLTQERRDAIARVNDAMAAEALRVLGFAFGGMSQDALRTASAVGADLPVGALTWVGLAGMADPVRPGMAGLIRTLHDAGLRTVMMTGDQVATARAVARQLGLAEAGAGIEVFDVAEVERLSRQELIAAAGRAHVFARVSPAQKLLIVRALQEAGQRVAMTGDGINDSPALKAADVGIAMGGRTSSEAAREIADVVLQADDLAALAIAVERGRTTYINVRKSIRYLLATNLSEILVVLGATLAGFAEPLTAMQLLWINLVGDVLPGLGLACEPPEPGLMQQPPHDATKYILERNELTRLGLQGSVIAAGSLAALGWGASRHGAGAEARTMAFGSMVTAQLLHALTARSDRYGLLRGGTDPLPPNRPLRGLLLASVAVQGAGLLIPGLRNILGVVPLGPLDLAVTVAAGVVPFAANETLKAARLPAPRAA